MKITAVTNARVFDGEQVIGARTVVLDGAGIGAVGGPAEGYDYVKVMIEDGTVVGHPGLPVISDDVLAAAVREAHRHGKLAIAHATTIDGARRAVRAGVDGLGHLFADGPATPRHRGGHRRGRHVRHPDPDRPVLRHRPRRRTVRRRRAGEFQAEHAVARRAARLHERLPARRPGRRPGRGGGLF